MKKIGLYIHIPFCKQKCEYCDFKSYAGKEKLINEYIKWLKIEIGEVGNGNKLDYESGRDDLVVINTIYIGGGTPSVLEPEQIQEIMETIKNSFQIEKNAEITIEINPGTVDEEKLRIYKESGINRISIGLQSTHDRLLKKLGRIHTYQDFLETYNLARKIGFKNINVDLMLGLPNQTIHDLEDSIREIITLKPEHISVYSLIIEEGTPFEKKVLNNEMKLPDDELERKMYWKTKEMLQKAGYIHYEISNFAKKGYESKHNTNCWNQEEYIGVGVAAHSYTNNVRYSNIDSIEGYIENYKTGDISNNFIFHEKQDKNAKMKEFIMLGLRKIEGVSINKFKSKFAENPIYVFRNELEKLVNEELLEIDGDVIKLTDKGLDLANLVWEEFV